MAVKTERTCITIALCLISCLFFQFKLQSGLCDCKTKFNLPSPGGLQGPASQGPRRPLHEWPSVKSAPAYMQWRGLRLLVLGQHRSETQKSFLDLHTVVLVLQVWCCVVKHGLSVTLVFIMILKDTATFQVLQQQTTIANPCRPPHI